MDTPIKKINLFKFYKSDDYNEARVKFCALYIVLSYANELHEDIERLLKGYEGLFIGELKHSSKQATRAFEYFDKQYLLNVIDRGEAICDCTIDVTKKIDIQLEQSKFFLQEAEKAIRNLLDEQTENRIKDKEALHSTEGFEICGDEERRAALKAALDVARNHQKVDKVTNETDYLNGVRRGFNIAINYINRIYLQA